MLDPKIPKDRIKIINYLKQNLRIKKDELEELVSDIKSIELEIE